MDLRLYSEGDQVSIKRGGVNIAQEFSEATSRIWCTVLSTTSEDIDAIEKVQCKATRLVPGRDRVSFEERLKETGLYSQERRWL